MHQKYLCGFDVLHTVVQEQTPTGVHLLLLTTTTTVGPTIATRRCLGRPHHCHPESHAGMLRHEITRLAVDYTLKQIGNPETFEAPLGVGSDTRGEDEAPGLVDAK